MMEHSADLIRGRRSVRTFDGRTIHPHDLEKLRLFADNIENPYGIPLEFKFLDAKAYGLTCPVVSGTDLYVGAKIGNVPHTEEAFGFAFEMLILYAQSLGIGTVWLGGTMNRVAFERAMDLSENEKMPCASPLGYPAEKQSLREIMMRKAVQADNRMSFQSLFFDGDFRSPLSEEKAGILAEPLELVRWAPSAVNRQPWRVVINESGAHFYLKHSRGFSRGAAGDMQKIDLGIALCHFALSAKELGLNVEFSIRDPGIAAEPDTEYIASYLFL